MPSALEIAWILQTDKEIRKLKGLTWTNLFELALEKAGEKEAWRIFDEAIYGVKEATLEIRGFWPQEIDLRDIIHFLKTWTEWPKSFKSLVNEIELRLSLLERMRKKEFYVVGAEIEYIRAFTGENEGYKPKIKAIIIENLERERYKISEGAIIPV